MRRRSVAAIVGPTHNSKKSVTEAAEIWSVSERLRGEPKVAAILQSHIKFQLSCTCSPTYTTYRTTLPNFQKVPAPRSSHSTPHSPFARGPCRQGVVVASGLAEQSYQTLAKLPWNLSRRKAVGRMFHSEITIQEATRHLRANVKPSDGESLSAWPRTGREWPLPYPGTWRPQVNTSSVAARFHASRLPTYLPRLATAVLLCCGIEKTLCEARCKRRYPPPRMVVSAATDRATVRCLHRTGYHNGDTTLARPRVPSLSVDRLAEADCPHGRRLAPPLDESPWAVPGARGGGVPACQQNHHVEVGVVVYRSRCNILPLRGQRDGDRFPTSPLHSISRRPVPPRLPPCSL